MTGVSFPYRRVVRVSADALLDVPGVWDKLLPLKTLVANVVEENNALRARGDRHYRDLKLVFGLLVVSTLGLAGTWVGIWLKLI
jgi:hypothetical protein